MKIFKNIIFVPIFMVLIILSMVIVFMVIENNDKADKYYKTVIYYSEKYKINPEFALSVIRAESKFNKNAVSSKGAVGLMQIMPETADFIAEKIKYKGKINLKNPELNINFGCFYLKYLENLFKDKKVVLCAYNAGEGNIRNWLMDENYSSDGLTIYKIPYKETADYVKKVEKFQKHYKKYLIKKGYYVKKT